MINTYKYPKVSLPERLSAARQNMVPMGEELLQALGKPKEQNMPAVKDTNKWAVMMCVVIAVFIPFFIYAKIPFIGWCFVIPLFVLSVVFAFLEVKENKIKKHLKPLYSEYNSEVFNRSVDLKNRLAAYRQKSSDWNYIAKFRRDEMAKVLKSTDLDTFPCENKQDNSLYQEFYKKLSETFGNNLFFNRYVKNFSVNSEGEDIEEHIKSDCMLVFAGKKFCMAITVDVPYSLETREPVHYFDVVDNNPGCSFEHSETVFCNKGWAVIRFSEYQVMKQPAECCRFVADIARIFVGDSEVAWNGDDKIGPVDMHNLWTVEQCRFYAEHNFRESYLKGEVDLPMPEYVSEMLKDIEKQREDFQIQKQQFESRVKQLDADMQRLEAEKVQLQEGSQQLDAQIQQFEIDKESFLADKQQFYSDRHQFEESKKELEESKKQLEEAEKQLEEAEKQSEKKEEIIETPQTEEKIDGGEKEEEQSTAFLQEKIAEYYASENWEKLVDACNGLLKLKPESDTAYLRRGSANGNLGRFDDAVLDFEKAVSINPHNADAYYNLGIADCMKQKYEDAIGHLKTAVENGIDDKRKVYSLIANIYKDYLFDMPKYSEYMELSETGSALKANSNGQDSDVENSAVSVVENADVFDIEDFVVENINVFRAAVSEAAFAFDDTYIAASTSERNLKVFSQDFQLVLEGNYPAFVMAFGKKYLALGGHGILKVLETDNNFASCAEFSVSQNVVKKLFFHPQDDTVIFMSDNYNVWTVNILTGEIVKVIDDFKMLSFSVLGDYIVGKDYLNTVKIYSVDGLKPVYTMKLSSSIQLKSAFLNADSTKIIMCEKTGKLSVFDLESNKCLNAVDLKSEIVQVEVSTGEFYAVLTSDRKLRLFDMDGLELKREFSVHDMPKLIRIGWFGKKMALCGFDGTLRIVSLDKAQ
ncbi:MAG: tetratricopeptide repeat protein [Bacteroidales bacterium]|nr:tetratricopeptide repeat protein [Bacteroidales bacterium]